jgi:hypothetical protein
MTRLQWLLRYPEELGCGQPQSVSPGFRDFWFQAEGEGNHFAALELGQLELIESQRQTLHERRIVGVADAHARVCQLHVASEIDRRPSGDCGDKIDCQLAFPVVRIDATGARPKPAQQRILTKPWKQIVDNGGDRVLSAQSRVKRCRFLWHGEPLLSVLLGNRLQSMCRVSPFQGPP